MTGKSRGSKDVVAEFLAMEKTEAFDSTLAWTWEAHLNIGHAIAGDAVAFESSQKQDRKAHRQAIVRRHQAINGPRSIVATSPIYPQYYERDGNMEWRWRRRKHAKGCRDLVFAATLPVDPPLNMLLKGAHEDEVELIKQHAKMISHMRDQWTFYKQVSRMLRGRMQIVLNKREEAAKGLSSEDELIE